MFVKHCPDPALSSVLKFKTAESWTANETQEHLIEYQREARIKPQGKTSRLQQTKQAGIHTQTSAGEAVSADNSRMLACDQNEKVLSSSSQVESACIQSLIGLLYHMLELKVQSASVTPPGRERVNLLQRRCRVCQSVDHSTSMHCRQENLGHWRRECRQRMSRNDVMLPPTQTQPRDEQGGAGLN